MIHINSSYPEFASAIKDLKDRIKEAEDGVKDLKMELARIQDDLLPQKMTGDGLKSMHVDGIGRLTRTNQLQVSTKGGMQPVLKKWLKDNGYEELISESVNASTLKSFVKESIAEDRELPYECINLHAFERVTLTKK